MCLPCETLLVSRSPGRRKSPVGLSPKELPYEFWRENIMDERLAYLDYDEKYALYNEWLLDVKATREKANKIYAHCNDC